MIEVFNKNEAKPSTLCAWLGCWKGCKVSVELEPWVNIEKN